VRVNASRLIRGLLALGAGAALAACSAGTKTPVGGFTVAQHGAADPGVARAAPVARASGTYKVGEPYQIAGRTYVPREDPGYVEVGVASWYGADFHGRLTANGEIYDLKGFTAAHRTLPLPSYVRVTNLENGRSMLVRVNDRGPFARDRIIDVSGTVAGMLAFVDEGTARVKVEYVAPAPLESRDDKMLLASYRPSGPPFVPPGVAPGPLMVAAATAPQGAGGRFSDEAFRPMPQRAGPAAATADTSDLLTQLILRASLSSSYAPERAPTAAQRAVNELAAGGELAAALARAAAREASARN
jgi:rare lipoprotein A